MPTIWGVHLEWDDGSTPSSEKDIAIGWAELGDLRTLTPTRDDFKKAFVETYPQEKPGAVPVKAGILFRFAHEMKVGHVVVYPSKQDRMINIGTIAADYRFAKSSDPNYPHRRRIDWKAHKPGRSFRIPLSMRSALRSLFSR